MSRFKRITDLFCKALPACWPSSPKHCVVWNCLGVVSGSSSPGPKLLSDFDNAYTNSTAQGDGGSFKNRKPKGELGCCESGWQSEATDGLKGA